MTGAGPQILNLTVELWFGAGRRLDAATMLGVVQRTLPASRLVDGDPDVVMIAHEGFRHVLGDGTEAPVLTVVLPPNHDVDRRPDDLSQTWHFADGAAVLQLAGTSRGIMEAMGAPAAPAVRVELFHATLRAAMAQLEPVAVWSPHARKLVRPDRVAADPLAALVNVRMFGIGDEPDTFVMDTVGLHVLGLPDVQCHFRGLEPERVAGLLDDVARYLVERGDVIDDGNTVPAGDEHWTCGHEMALVGPERVVLDLDPGPAHAAGDRTG